MQSPRDTLDARHRGTDQRLATDSLPMPELVTWKSFDGREISGFLYRPPARFTGPRPVIIESTAGPRDRAGRGSSGATTIC